MTPQIDDVRHLHPSAGVTPEEREHLEAVHAVLFDPEIMDTAIIGAMDDRAVYDYDKLVDAVATLIEGSVEERHEGALEWVDFNTLGSLAGGRPDDPVVLALVVEPDLLDEEETPIEYQGKTWVRLGI